MEAPNVNPSPRAKFQAIKACVDAHRSLIERQDFVLAIDTAEKEFVWQKASLVGNANDAAAAFYKLQGVHEFIKTLRTLAEQPTPLPQLDSRGISHEFK